MKRTIVIAAALAVIVLMLGAQAPASRLTGVWEGPISVMGTELKIVVTFEETAGELKGKIDVPRQGAFGLELQNIKQDGDKVHFQFQAGPTVAEFEAILKDGVMAGDFLQSGVKGTFKLTRGTAAPPAAVSGEKEPEPLPYKTEDVSIQNVGIKLAGTLTIPEGKGPFPAVIMITGSGAQNRDEELFGFKPFRIIADHLTRRGIVVLRCDDRGIGGSTGNTALSTALDFSGDVAAQAAFLRTRSEIKENGIGLVGHSEGGIVAPLAASKGGFAFIVLIAGPSVTGEEVILEQARLISKAGGVKDEVIEANLADQKKIFALVKSPGNEKEIESTITEATHKSFEAMTPEEKKSIADPEAFIKNYVKGQMASLGSPWFRYFISYDPAPALRQVKCPILALYGAKDLQVPPAQSVPVLEKIVKEGKNRDVTIKVMPEANHLFLKAKTGSPSEYSTMDKTFVPGFLDTISAWILEKIKRT